ncbi:nuclear transport factor 2 family protein [Clostridium sp. YIM B02505]|uniref:Nuclear transport factor 2 family protein n=1 Tax=Clostridium yunnanense TaxID=2800325 RepID=A0ABS1EMX6_9CLOT|nr:nuclear transport factor 2 family protein [Clostridium yunnanense]MBK1810716.1 nuclear transport factor 2 family protein [Clostridium yunnanense]
MDIKKRVLNFWETVIEQNPTKIQTYFQSNAIINWHNTNESFTPEEYIIANCEYPGKWCGEVERIEIIDDLVISVTRVWLADKSVSVHATSFFKFSGEKIVSLDEYWGDDGAAPQWRQDKKIGKAIK